MSELDFDSSDELADRKMNHTFSPRQFSPDGGAKTKKRFRLNYGSTKLTCRSEITVDSDDSVKIASQQQQNTHTEKQDELRSVVDTSTAMTKIVKKSISRRRRKIDSNQHLGKLKRRNMKDDFSVSYSPENFTSTPSNSIFSLSSGSICASKITKRSDDSVNDDTKMQVLVEESYLNHVFQSPQSICAEDESSKISTEEQNINGVDFSQSPESSHGHSSIISCSNDGIVTTRAGTDVFAAQDAGAFRMVLDDCLYYCSSFLSEVENGRSIYSCSIAAESICDLAVMLSSKKTRSILINFGESDKPTDGSVGEPSALQAILDTVSHVPNRILGSSFPKTGYKTTTQSRSILNEEDNSIPWSDITKTDTIDTKQVDSGSSKTMDRTKSSRQRLALDYSIPNTAALNRVVSRGLTIIFHYLSSDCLPSRENSAFGNNATAARQFRTTLLQAHSTLRGISRLLLDDVIVTKILSSFEVKADVECQGNIERIESFVAPEYTDTERLEEGYSNRDPTAIGRNKKKNKKNFCNDHADPNNIHIFDQTPNNGLDFASDDGSSYYCYSKSLDTSNQKIPSKLRHKLASAETHIRVKHSYLHEIFQSLSCKRCCSGPDSMTKQNPGYLSLDALSIVLSDELKGNRSEEFRSEQTNGFNETYEFSEKEDLKNELDIESELSSHPLIYKNRMVQESGSLPFIARAMTEALEAAVHLAVSQDNCDRCCTYIRDRIQSLAAIINDICLLCNDNRVRLCQVTSDDNVPFLMTSLMKSVSYMFTLESICSINMRQMFADIGLSSLRVLTSLTHENNIAGFQICQQYSFSRPQLLSVDYLSGIEMTFTLLHSLIVQQEKYKNDMPTIDFIETKKSRAQHVFDSIIFCLNSMTNVLESSSSLDMCKILMQMKFPPEGSILPQNGENALSWLSSWVVEQTIPFRDAVMDSASSISKKSRVLKSEEDEYLLCAGNGFVLLACILRQSSIIQGNEDDIFFSLKVKEIILEPFPSNDGGKLKLAINTLKAFCNFYRYSIGDLSVAIIEPVSNLVEVLESINEGCKN